MARALAAVWPLVKGCITGSVVGITVADWVASVVSMDGASRHPTFDPQQAERALVEKRCLYRYDFSRGDVVVFRSPRNHRELMVKRLIALPGDWIQIPEKQEILLTWVPMGLLRGRVTHIIWPPQRIGRVDRKCLKEGLCHCDLLLEPIAGFFEKRTNYRKCLAQALGSSHLKEEPRVW